MVGHSLGVDADEFLKLSLGANNFGRSCGSTEPSRSTGKLASARTADHDVFLGRMLDGVVRPGFGIVHLYLAGSDFGLGGA
jgi:hypothetical protein